MSNENNINLKNETKNDSLSTSVDILNHFVDKNIKIKEETKESLINYIKNNDYTEDTEEIKEEKNDINFENTMIKIKEKCNDTIKEMIEKNKINIQFKSMINNRMNQLGININKKVINNTQKEKKKTIEKALNCIKKMAASENGLTEKDLNNLNSLIKNNDESKPSEYDKFLKKETTKIIDTYLDKHNKQKLPVKLINNISKDIKSKR